ncbi:hypothetical protein GF342_05780 [Candidatus Woesearchaeota archaeon]|nr:hypothetical protein [Candidatus Woesearchaeota archaeon]
METKNLAIMFTDIKGFTSRTSVQSREEIEALLDLHESIVAPIFKKHHGTIVKTIGDAFMVTFNSPTDAVKCGLEVQDTLRKHNSTAIPEEQIHIRCGINAGEVNVKGNDIFGEAVNIASRIEGIAEVDEVYFTDAVYLAMNKAEIPSAEVGLRRLKGIPDEIKVYKVLREEGSLSKVMEERKTKALASDNIKKGSTVTSTTQNHQAPRRKWITKKRIIIGIGIIVVLAIIGNLANQDREDVTGYAIQGLNPEFEAETLKQVNTALRQESIERGIEITYFLREYDKETFNKRLQERLLALDEFMQEQLHTTAFSHDLAGRIHTTADTGDEQEIKKLLDIITILEKEYGIHHTEELDVALSRLQETRDTPIEFNEHPLVEDMRWATKDKDVEWGSELLLQIKEDMPPLVLQTAQELREMIHFVSNENDYQLRLAEEMFDSVRRQDEDRGWALAELLDQLRPQLEHTIPELEEANIQLNEFLKR